MKYTKALLIVLLLFGQSLFAQNGGTQDLRARLDSVEKKLAAVEQAKEISEKVLDRMNLWIGIILGFTGLVSFYQQQSSKKERKSQDERAREVTAQFERAQTRSEEQNKALLTEVRQNIKASSEFIVSVQGVFAFIKEAEKIKDEFIKDTKEREVQMQQENKAREQQVRDCNGEAMRLLGGINKHNLQYAYNLRACESFALKQLGLINQPRIGKTVKLNPGCCLVLAISDLGKHQFKDAQVYLNKCKEAIADIEKEGLSHAGSDIFPENGIVSAAGGENKWMNKVANLCLFIEGLLHFKKGSYTEAYESFEKAREREDNDLHAQFLGLQSLYFGQNVAFDRINAYAKVLETKIGSLPDNDPDKLAGLIQLNIWMGILYSPGKGVPYPSVKDGGLAKGYFQKAFTYCKEPNCAVRVGKDNAHLVGAGFFYYAQVMDPSHTVQSPLSDIGRVYTASITRLEACLSTIEDSDLVFQIKLMLGIANKKLGNHDMVHEHVLEAMDVFKDFKSVSKYRIFSPRSLNHLPCAEAEADMHAIKVNDIVIPVK